MDRRPKTRPRCGIATFAAVLAVAPLVRAGPSWTATGVNGMVATDSPEASRAGMAILTAGGNAIDAAVAISFALAVTRPESTGLGGGGFMIARMADGKVIVQDFRETAPAAATANMFRQALRSNPQRRLPSRFGHLAVAVPGVVAGRCQALAQYGTMPLARVLVPAITLAKTGFPVDQHYVDSVSNALEAYQRDPTLKDSCAYVYATHLLHGRARAVRDRLLQPDLARLLEGIADGGSEFFYRGPVAQAIVAEMEKHGGLITLEDLAGYAVKAREPIRSTYGEYEIVGMPPPSSGGIALAETLNILETVRFRSVRERDPNLAIHFQVEALKHAFADRARWLGDADFCTVPVDLLTSKPYAVQLARGLSPRAAADLETYGTAIPPEDAGTSHVCVVDRWGNAVVTTETINTDFGSLAAVAEWGLILNNQMDDFATEPGEPNAYGLVQSSRNSIAAAKRPLSSMAPTIVLKNGKLHLLLGASGGPRIISSVLSVLLSVIDAGMPLEEAVLATRPHHQWKPDTVYFNKPPSKSTQAGLIERGHQLSDRRRTGVVQAILRAPHGWVGASDPAKGGIPVGY